MTDSWLATVAYFLMFGTIAVERDRGKADHHVGVRETSPSDRIGSDKPILLSIWVSNSFAD